ncbi:hypothetical protein PVL29_024236 [Vitis rotundifolia]|uniref:Uncharacterized protein n=1 Tax=Vitis rotundifolia TaxID=103349 RepID=A0AA39D8S7_VITRO|nr:hypothetical protein PVL29_024236 [Vitis rotundifolia]
MGSESHANAYKRRRRDGEGRSDTEEDINGGSESMTVSEEEDNEEGTDNESARGYASESIIAQSEDAEIEGDDEASDTDQMHGLDVDDQSAPAPLEGCRKASNTMHQ